MTSGLKSRAAARPKLSAYRSSLWVIWGKEWEQNQHKLISRKVKKKNSPSDPIYPWSACRGWDPPVKVICDNIQGDFLNYPPTLVDCSEPKWKMANEPTRGSFRWSITWKSSSGWLPGTSSDPSLIFALPCLWVTSSLLAVRLDWCDSGVWRFTQPPYP